MLVADPATAGPLLDVAVLLAASRTNSEVVLTHLVPHRDGRLEVGSGLGGELLAMTQTMGALQALTAGAQARGASAVVQSRFSDDVAAELPGFIAAAEPDTIVLGRDGGLADALRAGGTIQVVLVLKALPPEPTAAVARCARGSDGEAAVQVAAQLSVASGLDLVLTPAGRPGTSLAAALTKRGLRARAGAPPAGAVVVAPAGDDPNRLAGAEAAGDVHLAVVAGSNEASDNPDHWVKALDGRSNQERSNQERSQQESRQP